MSDPQLSHIDASGRAVMVDVTEKPVTAREAVAEAWVTMQPETLALIGEGRHRKGDVLTIARLAGIQAAKRTHELIPLCHPLLLSAIAVDCVLDHERHAVHITTHCRLAGQTGVEMEALTAATVAALTIYDMCKAVDRGMEISAVRLLEKRGGRSGEWQAQRREAP